MAQTLTRQVILETMTCGECGIVFAAPASFWRERREEHRGWYCPNGHSRIFTETEADRLRQALAANERELARRIAQLDQAEARARELDQEARTSKAALARVQRRVQHGVCPCCNRTFQNLQRHMHGQHPTYVETEAAHPETYVCRYCRGHFQTERGLRIHRGRMHAS